MVGERVVAVVQTPAVIMKEGKQRKRGGLGLTLTQREWRMKHMFFSLFFFLTMLSNFPNLSVKVKHYPAVGLLTVGKSVRFWKSDFPNSMQAPLSRKIWIIVTARRGEGRGQWPSYIVLTSQNDLQHEEHNLWSEGWLGDISESQLSCWQHVGGARWH